MRIDQADYLDFQSLQDSKQTASFIPAESTATQASIALAEVRAEALEETLEGLSLGLSQIMKKIADANKKQSALFNGVEKLLQQLDEKQRGSIEQIAKQLLSFKDGDKILQQIPQLALNKGQLIFLLAILQGMTSLALSERSKIKQFLMSLLAEEDIELALIAASQGMTIDTSRLQAYRQLYQHAARGEKGLSHWFKLLQEHKDRRRTIQLLIRAISEPLVSHEQLDMTKLVTTIDDLRRLWLFLAFNEHCASLSRTLNLANDTVAEISIELLEQSWIYPEALAQLVIKLPLTTLQHLIFLRKWREIMVVMSEACYRDPEQKEHILEVMLQLLEQWNDKYAV
ncbi:HrpJ domain-containing protein [Arsenophonus nasoniae]|uniref:HrpJ domain-containing protein n=1 Tax=Arsenophonus nasoniae TaxID=638 RepID=A0AA95G9X3_9GAMM|nr:HrpJ domain-containing protein [Arsenophonus nasoniae]WGL95001.1 HrpJ domain-containing protein [Arsenophonus nasoniae]WGM01879.1 HrpJ domain-containing protein [Arsenophonus nasoniae]